MTTTNLPNGVTNADSNSAMGTLTQLDPTKLHTYYNDFNSYNAADWAIITDEQGTSDATQALVDEAGGVIQLTNDNATGDFTGFEIANETFKFVSGKKLYFKARVKLLDIISTSAIGLSTRANTNDGIYFSNLPGGGSYTFQLVKNGNRTISPIIPNFSSDTYFEVAFVYDGRSEIQYWFDDSLIGALDITNSNVPDDTELTIAFILTNSAISGSNSMNIDYVHTANER